MSYSSEDETDISDSELDEYVDRCYGQLKDNIHKIQFSDTLYRCPYCPGKKKIVYLPKDLLQHSSDIGKGSQKKDIKHKAKHLGLVKFIKNEIDHGDLSSELAGLALDRPNASNDLFVWPWVGILANVDTNSGIGLKSDLKKRGFDPARVRHLPSGGYAVVEFKRDWSGFYDAIMFEKGYEVDGRGKKEYRAGTCLADSGLYGWVAREDDYKSEGVLGQYLEKNGDLKTIGEVEAEEKRKTGLLIEDLSNTIQELRARVEELEGK